MRNKSSKQYLNHHSLNLIRQHRQHTLLRQQCSSGSKLKSNYLLSHNMTMNNLTQQNILSEESPVNILHNNTNKNINKVDQTQFVLNSFRIENSINNQTNCSNQGLNY